MFFSVCVNLLLLCIYGILVKKIVFCFVTISEHISSIKVQKQREKQKERQYSKLVAILPQSTIYFLWGEIALYIKIGLISILVA
jgi:hypothetical protein